MLLYYRCDSRQLFNPIPETLHLLMLLHFAGRSVQRKAPKSDAKWLKGLHTDSK